MLAGVLYIVGENTDNYWLRMITKPIPVLAMALWLYMLPHKGRFQYAVIAGLLLCAMGDILLEASPDTFLFGLISFLLGHIAYIVAFLQDSRERYPGRALLAYGYGALVFAYLVVAGDMGNMTIPVLLYVMVITTMLWRASCRVGAPGVVERSAWAGLVGALLFTMSDTPLALGMFAGLRPLGPHFVILTYWAGQLGITLSAAWQVAQTESVKVSN